MGYKAPCLEVAVCTVNAPNTFGKIQQRAHHNLATFAGFICGVALRGLDNQHSSADLILWDSEDAAKGAAGAIQTDERFTSFMQGIESVRHVAHYMGASTEALNHLSESPIIEVAAYEVSAQGGIAELRQEVHTALRTVEGASPQIAGICTDHPLSLLDLIGWSSKAVHEAAPGILMERHPEFQSFFSGMEKMEVFELFEVVR